MDLSAVEQVIDDYRPTYKRCKLDDRCLLNSHVPVDPIRMRNPDHLADDPRAYVTSCLSYSIQFFVRSMSAKTIVIRASSKDTVISVINKIKEFTRMNITEMRLIYRGRQLQDKHTLAECSIQSDSSLTLTGRLRSTEFPNGWQLLNDLVYSICWLCDHNNGYAMRFVKENSVHRLLEEFLSRAPSIDYSEENDNSWDYLKLFIFSDAHTALVKLYLSPVPGNRTIAEKAIQLFQVPIQAQYTPIMLEFCRLLAVTAGKRDPLYVACRNTLSSLLECQDSSYFAHSDSLTVISDLFPFVSELADILIAGLSLDTMFVLPGDLTDFSNFLHAVRRAIQKWIGGEGPIPDLLYSCIHPWYKERIDFLYAIFNGLLGKVDQCLVKVEVFLAEEGRIQGESCWRMWSHLLVVLTELNSFSKIYKDGVELIHRVLVARRFPLNALIRRAKRSDSLSWLLNHKDITDFEARQNLVMMMFPGGKDDYGELHEMLIDRTQLLSESFEYIGQAEASALHGWIFMEFKNEDATGPGVLREWFCLLCRAIFNPQNVLFLPCPNDRRRFFPNPASVVDPLHLKYFSFCGRVIALALMHKVQVGIVFDRVFFLQLAGGVVTLEDIQDADPCLYMSCKKIMEMKAEHLDLDILGLTFIREIEELGTQRAVELCPGGKDIVVDSKNRAEYVNLLIQHRFVTSISEQVSHFAKGFSDVLSNPKLQKCFFQSLDLEDFDRMLGGSDSVISVREWKAHTEYNGYRAKDRQICWFWKIVEGMSAKQMRLLLFFWTSLRYLPIDGFGGLDSKLHIYKTSDSHDRLPTSHTCFLHLCLPKYPSISVMRDRLLLITQEHVSCSFGIW